MENLDLKIKNALFEYLLRIGDDLLILGHRLSEWCGHAPILEEDIALSNIALDCIGQANNLYQLVAEIEGKERTEDDLAFFRDAIEFKNIQLVELPIGDFAFTIARQYLFDTFSYLLFEQLQKSSIEKLSGIFQKAFKEVKYHKRHSTEWIYRLGDGTDESHSRLQIAIDDLWMYTAELFYSDEVEEVLIKEKIIPEIRQFKNEWLKTVSDVLTKATIILPDDNQFKVNGSRKGFHSEHLGHLLSEMQIVARSYPGAKW